MVLIVQKMTAKEEFNSELWWMLKKLKAEHALSLKGEDVVVDKDRMFPPEHIGDKVPFPEQQLRALYKLQELGVLKIEIETHYNKGEKIFGKHISNTNFSTHYEVHIDSKKFEILYKEIEGKINSQENLVDSRFPVFNLEKGELFFAEKIIKIRKSSKQYEFLRILFSEKDKDWQFSEIMEKIDVGNENWKKLYDITNAIKNKIATETGIKDFFITTTQAVRINSKYIPKNS